MRLPLNNQQLNFGFSPNVYYRNRFPNFNPFYLFQNKAENKMLSHFIIVFFNALFYILFQYEITEDNLSELSDDQDESILKST